MILLAYAVLHDDPPIVYAAEDVDVLQRVLALKVVAATSAAVIPAGQLERLRQALLEERWGNAVTDWIEVTGIPIDVYSNELEVWTADRLADPELAGIELQLTPLFSDD